MKKVISISLFLFAFGVLLASSLEFSRLNARPEGDNVVVEWILGEEKSVAKYELYRANQGIFSKITEKDAKGDNTSYKHVDVEAFIKNIKKPTTQEQIDLKYKVKVIYKDGSSVDSEEIEISHHVSSVKRTWGMIKELFR